jgi:hypothetical protein
LSLDRKFIKSLPDKGEKIHTLVEKLKKLIAKREQEDDLSSKFKRINLSQDMYIGQEVELDSDDDDDDDDNMLVSEKDSLTPPGPPQPAAQECVSSTQSSPKKQLSEKWAYDSAVTHCKPHAFEVMCLKIT